MEQKISRILSDLDFSFTNFVGVRLEWILMLIYWIEVKKTEFAYLWSLLWYKRHEAS